MVINKSVCFPHTFLVILLGFELIQFKCSISNCLERSAGNVDILHACILGDNKTYTERHS